MPTKRRGSYRGRLYETDEKWKILDQVYGLRVDHGFRGFEIRLSLTDPRVPERIRNAAFGWDIELLRRDMFMRLPANYEDWSEAVATGQVNSSLNSWFTKRVLEFRWDYNARKLEQWIDDKLGLRDTFESSITSNPAQSSIDEDAAGGSECTDQFAADPRTIPLSVRTLIATKAPTDAQGFKIHLDNLMLGGIGVVVPHRLVCRLQCARSRNVCNATLSLDCEWFQKPCPCAAMHYGSLLPIFAHAQSGMLAFIKVHQGVVTYVSSCEVIVTCLECANEVLIELKPDRRCEQSCFRCHKQLVMEFKTYVITKEISMSAVDRRAIVTAKMERRAADALKLTKPLPRNGACDHSKQPYRWFRYQCCGKTFPCNTCHNASACNVDAMDKVASRMICGFCLHEQSSQVNICTCGNVVGRRLRATRHWEGGKGCRDRALMDIHDSRKFRGLMKTTSMKSTRIGVEAKTCRGAKTKARTDGISESDYPLP